MTGKSISEITDEELVDRAGSVVVGTPSGLIAQEAQAELLRRNTAAINNMNESSGKFSHVTTGLTLIMTALVVVQIILALYTSNLETSIKWILGLAFIGFLFLIFWDFLKDLHA